MVRLSGDYVIDVWDEKGERIIGLEEMAENLWWNWHPEDRMLVPLYYKTSEEGIPTDWVKVMKESMRSVAPRFCARCMVKEYVQK